MSDPREDFYDGDLTGSRPGASSTGSIWGRELLEHFRTSYSYSSSVIQGRLYGPPATPPAPEPKQGELPLGPAPEPLTLEPPPSPEPPPPPPPAPTWFRATVRLWRFFTGRGL